MAVGFRATSTGYRAELDAHERRLLSTLCGDVIQLLEGRAGAEDPQPQTAAEAEADIPAGAVTDVEAGADADAAEEDPLFAHFRAELAGLGEEQPLEAPEDPVLRRLLPDASEDPEEAGQFRRLAEASLREAKIADLRAARMWLESSPIRLGEEQAPILGRALNDLRLTLSVRLGIEDDGDAEAVHQKAMHSKAKDTESFMAEIYTFITWLQETLFTAMLSHLPDDDDAEGGDA